ncbi:MAG: hypothetical protein MZV64_43350 [Ignavibacteriales bacterium]|nr:hypothetical protein [Ignavibacteriales bacterium]
MPFAMMSRFVAVSRRCVAVRLVPVVGRQRAGPSGFDGSSCTRLVSAATVFSKSPRRL